MAVQERLYTAEDLWERAHEERDKRFELLKGEIIETSSPGGLHGQTAGDIYVLLRTFTKQHQLGYVTVETGYIIATDPHTVLAPDVAFISHDRARTPLPEGFIPLAPDLAVEVISPGDTASIIEDKVGAYLSAGVRAIWIVYPRSKTVSVYAADATHRLTADDVLTGGDVLPGFSVKVGDIFAG